MSDMKQHIVPVAKQHTVEWEEVYIFREDTPEPLIFYRATTTCKDKSLMPINLIRNLREITGDPTIQVNKKTQKLQNFIAVQPPCKNPRLADTTTCSNIYKDGSRYYDPYDDWERADVCEECANTEICLCGHLFRLRRFIKHVPTNKICCVGACCITKIDPELGNEMIKGKCIECNNLLCDKTQSYQKLGFCSLQCLEVQYPNNELLKKCEFSKCRRYLYTIKKLIQNHCNRECKKQHALELANAAAELLAQSAIAEFREPAPKEPAFSTDLQNYQQYVRDFYDPNVIILCDCEKYYIPHKYRTTMDAVCLVCHTTKEKKYITKKLLKYMQDNNLVYAMA